MATDVPRIAVGQMSASSDVEKNLEVVADLCARAKDRGCAMLFLPECFAFIGVKGTDALAVMEPLDGPLLGRYRELAARHRLWLSLGGFAEKGPDRDRRFNAHVIVNDAGEIQASYRKIHLFDVDMGDVNGPVLMESATAAAGETLVTCDSPAGKLGLTVCYDLRFPEMIARPPSPPGRRTGRRSCERARSKRSRTLSPPRKRACTRRAERRTDTR
jgi:predicted amidohydrolase